MILPLFYHNNIHAYAYAYAWMFSNAENLGKVGSGSILIKRLGDPMN